MKKKIFTLSAILIIVICSLFFCISASAEVYSGKCGEKVTFTLDSETGLLEISGTGEMTNYQYSSKVPWDSYKSYVKTVKISDGVTSIGNYAFSFSKSLTSVTIPDSVTSIGDAAFSNCSVLTNIIIPNSTTIIGHCAFEDCSSLVSVSIPDTVTNIGSGVFLGTAYYNDILNWENENVLYIDNHLIEVKDSISGSYRIKAETITIACSAFSGCTNLTSITIPDSVTNIDFSVFFYCSSMVTFEVDENNGFYCDIDGILFTEDKKTLIAYPA